MSTIKRTPEKNLMVFTGRAHPELAEEVAADLGITLTPTSAYDFANSEIYVRFEESVRGSDAFVIQSHTAPVNEWIMEHLIMVDALKRASAKRITVVMPFYAYARQDLSSYVCEKYASDAGLDATRDLAIVSPDAGRIKVAEQWSARLGGAPLAFIHKTRDVNRPNESVANRVVGEVEGRTCILVDDMIDTGGTIVKAAEALQKEGAASVVIAVTHAILSDPAVDRLKNCPATEVIVTNTLPIASDRHFDTLTVLSIAPLLSRAIR